MQKMYYYTSTDTMQKIMQNGNMWATNLAYMNDAREFKNGLVEIRDILQDKRGIKRWGRTHSVYKERIEQFEKIDLSELFRDDKIEELVNVSSKYTLSFCKKKDLLSQWIAYARESGVCMEMQFDLKREENFNIYKKDPVAKKREIRKTGKPKEVLYYTNTSDMAEKERKSTKSEILKRIFADEHVTEDAIGNKWREISTYVKHYDFYQEEEYRIVFETSAWEPFRIGYRMDKHILKPYLDVECENGWPVSMIMVGPGYNQQVVYDSIRFYLNHEEVRSSLLCRIEQWKEHLREYVADVSSKYGHSEYEENIKEWIDRLKEDDIKELGSRALIQSLLIDFMKKSGDNYEEYLKQHYFTASGIILERSAIPYIY